MNYMVPVVVSDPKFTELVDRYELARVLVAECESRIKQQEAQSILREVGADLSAQTFTLQMAWEVSAKLRRIEAMG